MSNKPKIREYKTMKKLAQRLRDDFKSGGQDFVLLYAKALFRKNLAAFLDKYKFNLPEIFADKPKQEAQP